MKLDKDTQNNQDVEFNQFDDDYSQMMDDYGTYDGNTSNSETVEPVDEYEDSVETAEDSLDFDDDGEVVDADDEYGDDDTVQDDSADDEDPILITLIDKDVPGLLAYMRGHKLNTSVITSDPAYIVDIMMTCYGKCDVLIIDTGSGLFATSEARKQILNIVQQCEGNLSQFFFYTDDAIKTDIQDQLGRRNKKQVTWEKFKTTQITVAAMMQHCMTYKSDDYEYQEIEEYSPDELLEKHKTIETNLQLDKQMPLPGLNVNNVRKNVVETDVDLLVGYKPIYKVKMKL